VIQAAQAPLRIVCAREIQESLKDSVKQLIEDKIADYGLEDHFEALKDETRAKNGGRFVYKGMWRNPDALKSLEGADVFWGEEANRFSARSIRLIRPTMRKPGSRMIWTWNPEFDHDPIDKLFRGPAGRRRTAWSARSPGRTTRSSPTRRCRRKWSNDYRVDPAMAEHVWGGQYVQAHGGRLLRRAARPGARGGAGHRAVARPDPAGARVLGPWAGATRRRSGSPVRRPRNPGARLHRGPRPGDGYYIARCASAAGRGAVRPAPRRRTSR
jgi:phage terminase large subunit